MTPFELNAEPRADLGKGASRRLRHAGKVPAILYGSDKDPEAITLKHSEILRQLENEAFYSHLLTVKVDGREEKAVLKDIQRHPAKPFVMHMDLQRVDATHKLHIHVPLHFINEEICVGVKSGGGAISHHVPEVEVTCLPKDLPEYIAVDMANIQVGAIIHMSELTLPEGVELTALAHGTEHDVPVVSVHKARGGGMEEEEEGGEA